MNQRQRQHLREHGRVVGVTHGAKRPARDDAQPRRIHHLHVPPALQRAHHPPADGVGQQKHPPQEHDFESGAREHARVRQDHPPEMWFGDFPRAPRRHLPLVAAREAQLREPQRAHQPEQREKRGYAHVHRSNSISALNPGPNAAARP